MFFACSDTDIAEAARRSRTEIDEHFQHWTASVPYRRFPHLLEAQILSNVPTLITIKRPSQFRALWYRTLALLGLRRAPAGGFGAWPHSSSGG